MTKIIQLLGMVEDLREELDRVRPQKLKCEECDEPLLKLSKPEIEDTGDAVLVTETWYCPNCVELAIQPEQSLS